MKKNRRRTGELKIDGRRARSQRSREAIVNATLELVQEGKPRPQAPEIARRAGVSRRIVFSHFRDLETVRAACLARFAQLEQERYWRAISPDLPLSTRLPAFVRQRSARLEFTTPFRHAVAVLAPSSPQIAAGLRAGTARAHAEVRMVFAAEIARARPTRRKNFSAALIVACSWHTWEILRSDLELNVSRARQAMTEMIASLIETEQKAGR